MIPDQLPPQMPPEMGGEPMPPQGPPMGGPPQGPPMPPEMGGAPPGMGMAPEMGGAPPGMGMPPEEGLINMESDALQMDEVSSNETALDLVTKAKTAMYGERFDKYMEVLQGSDNIVEDLAMVSLDLIIPGLKSTTSSGGQVPFDHIIDASAEIVSEAYDLVVQTGIYEPGSDEELERNQNITLTMVAGELGKTFSTEGSLPQDKVSNFIETVLDGHYNDYIDPQGAGTENMNPEDLAHMVAPDIPQGGMEGPPMEGPPMGPPQGPPMGPPQGPPMGPPQGPPMEGPPPEEGLING